ncbi:MAG: replicative DNA helicase [Gemmataceae bacterium]
MQAVNGLADRIPPHNIDAERAVIGGILRDPQALPDVQAILRPESFAFDAHQRIYRVVCDLADEGKPVDLVTVHDRLKRAKLADDVGGSKYLAELWDAVPTASNVEYHAGLVREAAILRGLIHTGNEIVRDAFDRVGSPEELIDQAEQKLFQLGTVGEDADIVGAADLAREALASIDDRAARDGADGLLTGFHELDEVLSGLQAGQLVIIGARPSCGKSALALALANEAADRGSATLFVSLEMPKRELMDRLLSMRSGVAMARIRNGRLSADQADAVNQAAQEFARLPFHVWATTDLTAARLSSVVRRGIRKPGLKLVVVDYLQLMKADSDRDQRHLQIQKITGRLKQLALSCGIPVVILAQLNRSAENRTDPRPRLSDFRESGSIEQDADVALLLHPKPDPDADSPVWETEVIVAKNRNGPTASVTLGYRRALARFENAEVAAGC